MEKKLIGYYNGNEVCINENGVPVLIPPSKEEKINKSISSVNWDIRYLTKHLKELIYTQTKLRHEIKTYDNYLTEKQENKIKKQIFKNRIIINGLATYIGMLKHEKNELNKIHPKRMKPLRDENEKLKNRYDRLCKHCEKCHGNFNDDCRDCSTLDKRIDLLNKIEKLNKNSK